MGANIEGVDSLVETTEEMAVRWSGTVEFQVGTSVEYGAHVEFGRGFVFPEEAEALHFYVDGVEVFAQYSRPAEPQPYLRPAAEEASKHSRAAAEGSNDLDEVAEKLAMIVERIAKEEVPVESGTLRASIRYWRVN